MPWTGKDRNSSRPDQQLLHISRRWIRHPRGESPARDGFDVYGRGASARRTLSGEAGNFRTVASSSDRTSERIGRRGRSGCTASNQRRSRRRSRRQDSQSANSRQRMGADLSSLQVDIRVATQYGERRPRLSCSCGKLPRRIQVDVEKTSR